MVDQKWQDKEEVDPQKKIDRSHRRRDVCLMICSGFCSVIVMIWLMAVVLLSVWAKVEKARHPISGSE